MTTDDLRGLLSGDVVDAALAMLGTILRDGEVGVRITEVEAYAGAEDPASHAWRGPTLRNQAMFGPSGHAYVYLSYGMHWCLNVTAGPQGVPAAVLLRAGTVVEGQAAAAARRPGVSVRDQARGPGRLARTLDVGERHRGVDLLGPASSLWLVPGTPGGRVCRGPRVGVSRAADVPWRFWLPGESSVSSYKRSPRAEPKPGSLPDSRP